MAEGSSKCVAPCLESAVVWDWRRGVEVARWKEEDSTAEVTCISRNPCNATQYAVGYSDGSIRIWDSNSSMSNITFNGHKAAVTVLCFDSLGARLASGSKDTDLVVWDISGECGLFRLKGHKDQVTGLVFLPGSSSRIDHLVSTSKDTLMKVWDLSTQHCIETIIAHRSEVWGLAASLDGKFLFTGAIDQEIRVWKVDADLIARKLQVVAAISDKSKSSSSNSSGGDASKNRAEEEDVSMKEEENDDDAIKESVTLHGVLERQSKERVVSLKVHPTGRFLAVQATDKSIQVFKIRNEEELKKRLTRKKKRLREKKKLQITMEEVGTNSAAQHEETEELFTLADEVVMHCIIRCSGKVRSFDFSSSTSSNKKMHKGVAVMDDSFNVVCALSNNSIEVYACGANDDEEGEREEAIRLLSSLDLQGHRSDIRTLALSSNDELILSGSNNGIKVWNVQTRQCIKTMDSGYALCSAFVPGNKHVIIGTKTGEIEIFDLSSASLLESIKAHDGPVWSIEVRPDKTGLTSGSADKQVKFWDFQLTAESENSITKKLGLVHTRTLKMSDDVLAVRHSPDGKLLAVSLLDSTVKVFFYDTLKFSLSLYGHKLPVLSMDISSDSAIIATASADKSIKIWGLDFGDCHRSILAHTDSVMSCKFVWGTHYLFSVGKDKCVKYWDGDKFEQIMKLEGHHGEVWALAVAKYGLFVVTGSHDRSIRIWEKTDEQLFLEEERERELEEMYEKSAVQDDDRHNKAIGSSADDGTGDLITDPLKRSDDKDEVGAAGKKSSETLKAGERIIEALDIWEHEVAGWKDYKQSLENGDKNAAPPSRSPYILALGNPDMSPEAYVMHVVEKIRSSDLEQALLVLPFVKVDALLKCISVWTEKACNIQLSNRVLNYILRVHHNQLSSASSSKTLEFFRNNSYQIRQWKDKIGFNMAGLKMLLASWEARHQSDFLDLTTDGEPQRQQSSAKDDSNSQKKRKRLVIQSN